MANVAYELAVRFGSVVWFRSEAARHPKGSPEYDLAAERLEPLEPLNLAAGQPIIWLHAVSMGEVGVAKVLVQELKKQSPCCCVVISTSTAAGLEAAKKIAECDAVVAARIDVRSLVASMFSSIKPAALILVEGDLWRNMLAIARRRQVPVFVANGKMSEKSLRLFQQFPLYARTLFSRVSHVYAQTGQYQERFMLSGLDSSRCEVSGNVKLDMSPPITDQAEVDQVLAATGCEPDAPIVTFGSLHPGEEVIAVRAMKRVWVGCPTAWALIAPRHIEKTPQIAAAIEAEMGAPPIIYSRAGCGVSTASRITIVDQMGLLMKLYAVADVGVVGGTFVPGVGGHNLTEPSFYGKPVLYGSYVYKQTGLHDLVTGFDAGRQTTAEALPDALSELMADKGLAQSMGENGLRMVGASRGASARIVADILRRLGL